MPIIKLRDKEYNLPGDMTLAQVYKRLRFISESYLAVREGEIITEDRLLKDKDIVKLVPVISGGNK
jgi:sulfur carrier protein ThiS